MQVSQKVKPRSPQCFPRNAVRGVKEVLTQSVAISCHPRCTKRRQPATTPLTRAPVSLGSATCRTFGRRISSSMDAISFPASCSFGEEPGTSPPGIPASLLDGDVVPAVSSSNRAGEKRREGKSLAKRTEAKKPSLTRLSFEKRNR
ncbi:hypothetical protein BHE74_00026446 [Ensete ventricosum]|nr:hypothetical protein GW17_00028989 [Ensete ventricosum]RWW66202.1 hypothetical protein BHE74_00026446 [Ensete ventricosum]RZR77251.1 hypothetical protein BHM03_00002263 [Ensete ventricosum]